MTTLHLTALEQFNGFCRAYYSDETSLIISRHNAEQLSKAYNLRIEVDNKNVNDTPRLVLK